MKIMNIRALIFSISILFCYSNIFGQSCQSILSSLDGMTFVFDNYNPKGKLTFTNTQIYSKVENAEIDITSYTTNRKNKDSDKVVSRMKCEGDQLSVSLDIWLNEIMEDNDETISISGEASGISFPMAPRVGLELEDIIANVRMQDSDLNVDVNVQMLNRKIVDAKNVSTKKGSYMCFVITSDYKVEIKLMGLPIIIRGSNKDYWCPTLGVTLYGETSRGKKSKKIYTYKWQDILSIS